MRDFYKVLQVDPDAEPEVIESAYRRLARKYHPDVNPSNEAKARITQINEAFEVLSDPSRRAEYDKRWKAAGNNSAGAKEQPGERQEPRGPSERSAKKPEQAGVPSQGDTARTTRVAAGVALLGVIVAVGVVVAIALSRGSDDSGAAPPPVEGVSSLTGLGVGVIEVVTGVGPVAESGDKAEVHYTGWLTDGRQFDSSLDRNETYTFRLDNGDVIAGWDDGVAGMAQGGIRRLVIPPELAYGDAGREGIPPGSELVFDIELIGLTKCGLAEDSPPPVDVSAQSFTTDGGVQVIIIEKGSEEAPTQAGDSVAMQYTGWLTADGTMFDSSYNRCEDFILVLGRGDVIRGWEEGIIGMSPGDVRRLIIPAELAYGEQARAGIPPNSSLTFDVELIAFGRPSPAE